MHVRGIQHDLYSSLPSHWIAKLLSNFKSELPCYITEALKMWVIPPWDIYLTEINMDMYTYLSTSVFIAALFIMTNWKQWKYPETRDLPNKLWHSNMWPLNIVLVKNMETYTVLVQKYYNVVYLDFSLPTKVHMYLKSRTAGYIGNKMILVDISG